MRPLPFAVNCEEAYPLLSGGAEYSFWLDSAREESLMSDCPRMGVVPAQLSPLRVDSARAAAESGGKTPSPSWRRALARDRACTRILRRQPVCLRVCVAVTWAISAMRRVPPWVWSTATGAGLPAGVGGADPGFSVVAGGPLPGA